MPHRPRLLSKEEFQACFFEPMRDVTNQHEAILDIWPYCDAINLDEIKVPHLNDVHYVYRDANERYEQVLIGTGRFNALLVIVINRRSFEIHGHYLLDLNAEFGLSGLHLKGVDRELDP